MSGVPIFIKYNGEWDHSWNYIGGEMKGVWVPLSTSYVGLLELLTNALGLRGSGRALVLKYVVETGMPPVKVECDSDVFFYLQLKKKDVHVLSKFPLCIEAVNDGAAPTEAGGSNRTPTCGPVVNANSDDAEQPPIAVMTSPEIAIDICGGECPHDEEEMNHEQPHPHSGDDIPIRNNTGSAGALSFVNGNSNQSVPDHVSGENSEAAVIADYGPSIIRVKSIYNDKKVLRYHLHRDAMSKHYQFKVKRSTTSLYHVVCKDDDKCGWQVRATKLKDSEMFVVKRFDAVHTCSVEIRQGHHRQASSWMIGECVKTKFVDPTCTSYRPWDIIRDLQNEFGVTFNYLRAWRAKESALCSLRGDDADSYQDLPAWSYIMGKANPGSDFHLQVDSDNQFKYFYMCLAASKQGWPHCRPVIVVDGSALKARYQGMLLSACGHDADGSIFPLAFGIGDSENDAHWEWFFTKLRESIGTRDELAIVADRHPSILKAVSKVYPEADFGVCTRHLCANLKTKFGKSFKSNTKCYYDCASRTYLVSEFHRQMGFISNSNPDIANYLMDADPKRWSRAYFNGRRYGIMTTNIAESMNNVDRKARRMPVGFLMEFLRSVMQRWHVERREAALHLQSRLAPKVEIRLQEYFGLGLSLTSRPADQFEYSVSNCKAETWIVDMEQRTCTCRQFQVDQIPCPHAMAVCNLRHFDPYQYCSGYYKKEALYATYAGVIHPVGSSASWEIPDEVKAQVVIPPKTKRKPGRPKVNRVLSQGEEATNIRCSRCGDYGHNRQTCSNPVPLRVPLTHRGSTSTSQIS